MVPRFTNQALMPRIISVASGDRGVSARRTDPSRSDLLLYARVGRPNRGTSRRASSPDPRVSSRVNRHYSHAAGEPRSSLVYIIHPSVAEFIPCCSCPCCSNARISHSKPTYSSILLFSFTMKASILSVFTILAGIVRKEPLEVAPWRLL